MPLRTGIVRPGRAAASGGAATSVVHSGTSITTTNITVASVSAGNLMVVGVSWDTSSGITCTGCTDGLGNTYTQVDNCHDTTSSQDLTVFTSVLTNAGSAAVNFTWAGGTPSGFRMQVAAEFTGMAGTTRDQTNKSVHLAAVTGTNGFTSAAITPTTSGQTVIAVGETHSSVTIAAGTGYTQAVELEGGPGINMEFLDQAAAASITGKWTIGANVNANAIVMSFKA